MFTMTARELSTDREFCWTPEKVELENILTRYWHTKPNERSVMLARRMICTDLGEAVNPVGLYEVLECEVLPFLAGTQWEVVRQEVWCDPGVKGTIEFRQLGVKE